MSDCQCVFKYGPHLTAFLLFVCFIFNCITVSCSDDGLIWTHLIIDGYYYDYSSWGSLGWQSEYSWMEYTDCSDSGSALGRLSIICLLISLVTTIVLIYFSIIRKNTNNLSIGTCALEQRYIIITICAIMFLFILPSASAYWSNCSDALWDASYDSGYEDWGPDYGLIIAWVHCAFLICIICINAIPWTEPETDEKEPKTPENKAESEGLVIVPTQRGQSEQSLPYGWSQHITSDGRVFYQDNVNKRTQWMRPTEEAVLDGWYKCITPDGRAFWTNSITKSTQWERPMMTKGCGDGMQQGEGVSPGAHVTPMTPVTPIASMTATAPVNEQVFTPTTPMAPINDEKSAERIPLSATGSSYHM